MKLLNVSPVKPGQRFKFEGGSITYGVERIKWCDVWDEWYVHATVLNGPAYVESDIGESLSFYIQRNHRLEILNDE